jgi:hypothetical protein
MKKILLALSLLTAAASQAATVSVASTITAANSPHGAVNGQVALKDQSGTTLPVGMRIRVGFFVGYTAAMDATLKLPGGALNLIPGSPVQFVPIGEPPTRPGYGDDTSTTNVTKLIASAVRWNTSYTNVNYVGAENDALDNNTIADGGLARGTKLFVMVYNTGSLTPNFADPNFQYGLYTDASFIVPETGSATLSINVANVDTAADVFYGALGASLHTAALTIIPEPSTGIFALIAGLGLIARRRR